MTSTLPTIRRSLAEGWALVLACALLAGGAALVFSLLQTEQYSASALLVFEDPEFDDQVLGVDSEPPADVAREIETQVELVDSQPVAAAAAKLLGGELTPGEIDAASSVTADLAADSATVVAEDPDPARAAQIANAVAESFVEHEREALQGRLAHSAERLERQLDAAHNSDGGEATIRTLEEKLGNVETLIALDAGEAQLAESAGPPSSPSTPKTARNLALGLFVGILVGGVAALLRARRGD